MIVAAGHKVFGWDFSTDDASAEVLRLKAEVATVFTIKASRSVRMLTEEEWRRLQEQFRGTRGQ